MAALQTIIPNVGEGVLVMLQSPQPLPTESILTALINEIATLTEDFIFVLDDYHIIAAQPVNDALTFLLDHLPPQMHLVIATREDPDLSLSRLPCSEPNDRTASRGSAFSFCRSGPLLNQTMDLNLTTEDIDTLETRTEGWIAGLQLAAISMQNRTDITQFYRIFHRQPPLCAGLSG